jgi:hypothetical protein
MPKARNEDADRQKGAGISYSVRAGEARETELAGYLLEWFNPPNKESDATPISRRGVSVVDNEEGNLVVERMGVEKIDRLRTKAGENFYRLFLEGIPGIPLRPRAYNVCSLWLEKNTTASERR